MCWPLAMDKRLQRGMEFGGPDCQFSLFDI